MYRLILLGCLLLAMAGCGAGALDTPVAESARAGADTGANPVFPTFDLTPSPSVTAEIPPTVTPDNSTPSPSIPPLYISAGLELAGGACCLSADAGETITFTARFQPTIAAGSLVEMRVLSSGSDFDVMAVELSRQPWEPFEAARSYATRASLDPFSYPICVQYRADRTVLSQVSCHAVAIRANIYPTAIPSITPIPLEGKVAMPDRVFVAMDNNQLKTVDIEVSFAATSPHAPITAMRAGVGYNASDILALPWEPLVAKRTYQATARLMQTFNWMVCAQYRDAHGNETAVVCGVTLLEGK
jgi:hypothetical protein